MPQSASYLQFVHSTSLDLDKAEKIAPFKNMTLEKFVIVHNNVYLHGYTCFFPVGFRRSTKDPISGCFLSLHIGWVTSISRSIKYRVAAEHEIKGSITFSDWATISDTGGSGVITTKKSVKSLADLKEKLGLSPNEKVISLSVHFQLQKSAFDIIPDILAIIKNDPTTIGTVIPLMYEDVKTKNEAMTDFKIVTKAKDELCCHKNILQYRSSYFKTLFSSTQGRENPGVSTPLPFSTTTLQEVLYFIYNDRPSDKFPNLDLKDLLNACEMLFLEKLKLICEMQYHQILKPSNALEILVIADRFNCAGLKNKAMVIASSIESSLKGLTEMGAQSLQNELIGLMVKRTRAHYVKTIID